MIAWLIGTQGASASAVAARYAALLQRIFVRQPMTSAGRLRDKYSGAAFAQILQAELGTGRMIDAALKPGELSARKVERAPRRACCLPPTSQPHLRPRAKIPNRK